MMAHSLKALEEWYHQKTDSLPFQQVAFKTEKVEKFKELNSKLQAKFKELDSKVNKVVDSTTSLKVDAYEIEISNARLSESKQKLSNSEKKLVEEETIIESLTLELKKLKQEAEIIPILEAQVKAHDEAEMIKKMYEDQIMNCNAELLKKEQKLRNNKKKLIERKRIIVSITLELNKLKQEAEIIPILKSQIAKHDAELFENEQKLRKNEEKLDEKEKLVESLTLELNKLKQEAEIIPVLKSQIAMHESDLNNEILARSKVNRPTQQANKFSIKSHGGCISKEACPSCGYVASNSFINCTLNPQPQFLNSLCQPNQPIGDHLQLGTDYPQRGGYQPPQQPQISSAYLPSLQNSVGYSFQHLQKDFQKWTSYSLNSPIDGTSKVLDLSNVQPIPACEGQHLSKLERRPKVENFRCPTCKFVFISLRTLLNHICSDQEWEA